VVEKTELRGGETKDTEAAWTVRKDERTIQLLDHAGKVLLQHDELNYPGIGPHHVKLFNGIADAHNATLLQPKEE
jgi:hypothetical protein